MQLGDEAKGRDAVVLLSGGLDSMVSAALAREAGYRLAATQASVALPSADTLRLTLQVENLGNAPVYEPWEPQAQVRDAAGQVLGTQALLNVAQVQDIIAGRPAQIDTRWTLPGAAPAGTYTLHLAWVRNPAGNHPPAKPGAFGM